MSCGDYHVKEPMVIGHECAGIIEEVGTEVKSLLPGDRVALEPGIGCWHCNPCKEGRYNLCHDMKFFATPPIHGSLADQVSQLCFHCLIEPQFGKTKTLKPLFGPIFEKYF